ncbi:hypothetical protein P8452_10459 [Trifolium repens]|nr:hypothetical protein P8452_10459 [Trifolium repens]
MAYDVDFSYNSFSRSIPPSWKNLKDLYNINLWSNKLSGEALVHLSCWTQLKTLNLGENEFSGTIPIKMSQKLEVLEQKELSKHLSDLHNMNNSLKQELGLSREQFEAKETENVYLKESISSISKALLENKANELTGVCTRLQDENSAKNSEIEKMIERVGLLESEIGGLKGHLSAYVPDAEIETCIGENNSALTQYTKKPDNIILPHT